MPFPLDPTFQFTGKPFLTAPDGTTAPDNAGNPVDLTGAPLAASPQTNGEQSGLLAGIGAFGAGLLTVGGLTNMAPGSVGRVLTLDGTNPGNRGSFPITTVFSKTLVEVANAGGVFPDTNTGATATISAFAANRVTLTGLTGFTAAMVGREITLAGAANAGNIGTFVISEFISPTSVQVINAAGVFPDANSGAITWTENIVPIAWTEEVLPTAFPPGDPLSYVVEQVIPLNYMQGTLGAPAGGGAKILPVNVNVDAPVAQMLGKSNPRVPPNGGSEIWPSGNPTPDAYELIPDGTVGPVTVLDPQNPVRLKPNSFFTVNQDPENPAFGLSPILPDGPAVRPPTPLVEVPEPGADSSVTKGGKFVYASVNNVVFS